MSRYRTIPVDVDAFQWNGSPELADALIGPGYWRLSADGTSALIVAWVEGPHPLVLRCDLGDWLVRDAKGHLVAVSAADFAAKYEPV